MFEREKGVCIGVMFASPFGMNNYNCKIWFFTYVVGYLIPYSWKNMHIMLECLHNVT
jgi:hypothetical protein